MVYRGSKIDKIKIKFNGHSFNMKSKGFTLIELLVVIAIIGILSSVVLASLTTARSRGVGAAIQSELANSRAQAELYYSTTGGNSYNTGSDVYTTGSDCTSGQTTNVLGGTNGLGNLLTDAAAKGGSLTCGATASQWAVEAAYNGTNYCVDSTGVSSSGSSTYALASGHTSCN